MPVGVSSLSTVCGGVAAFVRSALNAPAQNIDVTVGAPAVGSSDNNRVNLFFYRFEPFEFQAARRPHETWRLRMFCLVTAFGIQEASDADGVAAGENDLRLLGHVVRAFGEQPVLAAGTVDGEPVQLQTILLPLADEQLNQVWSTQGDTAYRPSVLYEMAVVPIVPDATHVPPPLVGQIGQETRADPSRRFDPFAGRYRGPLVPARRVDIADPRWAPACCWVDQGRCVESLTFDLAETAFGAIAPQIWLAGDPGVDCALIWQVWSNSVGWQPPSDPIVARPFGTAIDPDAVPPETAGVFPLSVAHPLAEPAAGDSTQALLYARREVVPMPGQPAVELRSNPLLLTLHRSA